MGVGVVGAALESRQGPCEEPHSHDFYHNTILCTGRLSVLLHVISRFRGNGTGDIPFAGFIDRTIIGGSLGEEAF